MALPELTKRLVEQKLAEWCKRRVPVAFQHELKLEFEISGMAVTIYISRPARNNPNEWLKLEVARLRFDSKTGLWSLYCRDRNAKWHRFDPAPAAADVDLLIAEIDRDSTGIFFS